MKYILANQWLRNIFLLLLILLILHLSDPQTLTLQEKGIAAIFFVAIYAASWLNNRMLFYALNTSQALPFFRARMNLWTFILFFIPLLGLMILVEHWAYLNITVPNQQPWEVGNSLLSCGVFLLIGFGINSAYREIIRRQTVLEQELLTKHNELRFLQNQVNPHFLFNSLNNLYSASLTEPQQISAHILQMADLLRYQLSCSKRALAPLQEEVFFLRNYIDVEQRRLGRQVVLELETVGDFTEKSIAPLLFLPFLENAFKYSTGGMAPAAIQIRIVATFNIVHFFVQNSLPDSSAPTPVSTGIGIENVQKRLQLLYPRQHDLTIKAAPASFSVDLTIRFQV